MTDVTLKKTNNFDIIRGDYCQFDVRYYKLIDGAWRCFSVIYEKSGTFWQCGILRQVGKTTALIQRAFEFASAKENVLFFINSYRVIDLLMPKLLDMNVPVKNANIEILKDGIKFSSGGSVKFLSTGFGPKVFNGLSNNFVMMFDNAVTAAEGYFRFVNNIQGVF